MHPALFLLLIITACRSSRADKQAEVSTTPTPTGDSGQGTVLPRDSGEAPPPMDLGPIGAWSTCPGTLTLDVDQFTWQNLFGTCTVRGTRSFEAGVLTLSGADFSSCPEPPWWLEIFPDGPAVFSPSITGTRLTLVPFSPLESGQVAQFEERLDYENWVMTTPEGYINNVYLCAVGGTFFGGMYQGVDGSCEFLSCSGGIHTLATTEHHETWTTSCKGNCPCGGVVTIESRTETTISGFYHAYNCARLHEGSFTGVPMDGSSAQAF